MIDHVWTVLCSRAVVDRRSNNVSLQNVLEQVAVEGVPTPSAMISIPLHVVTLWTRSNPEVPSRGRMRVRFLAPSGKEFGSLESDLDLTEYQRYRNLMSFDGVPMEEAGRHVFSVEIQHEGQREWHPVASIPLDLLFKSSEEVPAEGESE